MTCSYPWRFGELVVSENKSFEAGKHKDGLIAEKHRAQQTSHLQQDNTADNESLGIKYNNI